MNGNVLGAAQVWVFAHRRICGNKRVIGRYVVRYSPFLVAFCVAKGKGESPLDLVTSAEPLTGLLLAGLLVCRMLASSLVAGCTAWLD